MVTDVVASLPCRALPLGWTRASQLPLAAGTVSDEQLRSGFVALMLVSLLGLLMLTAVVVGARYVRRLNRRPTPPSKMASDRWYEKPLIEPTTGASNEETPDVE